MSDMADGATQAASAMDEVVVRSGELNGSVNVGSAAEQIGQVQEAAEGAVSGVSECSSILERFPTVFHAAAAGMRDEYLAALEGLPTATEQLDETRQAAEGATEAVQTLGQAMRASGAWQPGISASQVTISTVEPLDGRGFRPGLESANAIGGHYVEMLERVAQAAPRASEALGTMTDVPPRLDTSAEAMERLAYATEHLNEQTALTSGQLEEMSNSIGGMQRGTGIMEGLRRAVGALGEMARGAAAGFGGLLGSFMRIVRFRIFRTIIRAITTAFKEGMENVREYSKAINGLYAKDMANFDNAVLKMKNSLGASLAVAFQALLPLIHSVINALITLANTFNQVVSYFSGHATWTKAVDVVAADFEKTKKSASGASKAVKNLLADWDELNIIQSQNNGGGGSGTGLDPADYKKMFVEADYDTWLVWLKEHLTEIKSLAIAIGAAILAWKIGKVLASGLGSVLKYVLGIALVVFGITEAWAGLSDQLTNGVNWDNLKQSVGGVAAVVAGLAVMFGLTGLAIGLLVGGVVLLIAPLKELIETGKLSDESMTQLSIAIGAVGVAIALLTGSWIPLAIAGIIVLVGWIIQKWEDIKQWFIDRWSDVTGWWSSNVQPMLDSVVSWIDENVTTPITGLFSAMQTEIKNLMDDPVGWFSEKWNGLVVWFANNITIPISNLFIDVINGFISAINWFIQKLNSLNITIKLPDFMGGGEHKIGISGLQEIELIPKIGNLSVENGFDEYDLGKVQFLGIGVGQMVEALSGNDGTWDPSRDKRRNAVGMAGITPYQNDTVGPVYYPAKANRATDYGLVATDDRQMEEQNNLIRRIETIVQNISNKPFSVNIVPSASLGRVVSESQNQWNRTSGAATNYSNQVNAMR